MSDEAVNLFFTNLLCYLLIESDQFGSTGGSNVETKNGPRQGTTTPSLLTPEIRYVLKCNGSYSWTEKDIQFYNIPDSILFPLVCLRHEGL